MKYAQVKDKYSMRLNRAVDTLAELNVEMSKDILDGKDGAFNKDGSLTKKALESAFSATTELMAQALNDANDSKYELVLSRSSDEEECEEDCDCDGSCEDDEDEDDFNEMATKFSDSIIKASQKLLGEDEDYELDEHELFVSFTSAIKVLQKSLNDSNGTDYDLIGAGAKMKGIFKKSK